MPAWTDQERSRLLLAIIELLVPPKTSSKLPPWAEVAERMGTGFTQEAVRQQYQKLRKEGLPNTGSVPNTPQRKRVSKPHSTKKTPTRRSYGKRPFPQDDCEVREDEQRIKRERGEEPERQIIKTEIVDDNGIVRLDDDE